MRPNSKGSPVPVDLLNHALYMIYSKISTSRGVHSSGYSCVCTHTYIVCTARTGGRLYTHVGTFLRTVGIRHYALYDFLFGAAEPSASDQGFEIDPDVV